MTQGPQGPTPPGQPPGWPPGPGAPGQATPGYPPHAGQAQPGYPPQVGYLPPPGPPLGTGAPPTQDEKLWAALSHAAIFVFGIFGPLIVYLVYKEKSHFISHHAKQALIFQIVAVVGGIITCGLLTLVCMVFSIIAALKAYEGQYYTYPAMANITA